VAKVEDEATIHLKKKKKATIHSTTERTSQKEVDIWQGSQG